MYYIHIRRQTGHDAHDLLLGEEGEGDEGGGDQPDVDQEAGQAADNLPAPLLGQLDVLLLPQGVLLLADVQPELTEVQLDVLHVFIFYIC